MDLPTTELKLTKIPDLLNAIITSNPRIIHSLVGLRMEVYVVGFRFFVYQSGLSLSYLGLFQHISTGSRSPWAEPDTQS